MVPIYFSAALKTEDGQLLEIGEACISENDEAVTFVSSFVPLMKLGSNAQIVRMLGERELECFTGSVYLSSTNLLQITGVQPALITDMRRLFSVNESITTQILLAPGHSTNFNMQKAEKVSGVIRYLSPDVVKIFSMEFIKEGQFLVFSTDETSITLDKMLIKVKERILLKRNAALHLCEVVALSSANRRALAAFATRKKQEPTV